MKFTLIENDMYKLATEWESFKDYKMHYSEKCLGMLSGAPDEERLADNWIDSCWDSCTAVYQGEDGKYYAVKFDYRDNVLAPEPFCWHEVRRKDGTEF